MLRTICTVPLADKILQAFPFPSGKYDSPKMISTRYMAHHLCRLHVHTAFLSKHILQRMNFIRNVWRTTLTQELIEQIFTDYCTMIKIFLKNIRCKDLDVIIMTPSFTSLKRYCYFTASFSNHLFQLSDHSFTFFSVTGVSGLYKSGSFGVLFLIIFLE